MPGQTVLLVDDEMPVRTLMAAIVSRDGYRALQASDGPEALRIAATTPVDLVVTDVMMPGMSGPELVAELEARHLVKSSMLVSAGCPFEAGGGGRIPFLAKPFTVKDLLDRVRQALPALGLV
jgi:CheY-like chemotaxis protein